MRGTARTGRWILCAAAVLAGGCMTARIEQSRHTLTGIGDGDTVVVLARSYHNGNHTEDDFIECVDRQLALGPKPMKIIPQHAFRDDFYPWFEPRMAPKSPGELPRIMSEPAVAEKFREAGLRYIVWIEGSTEALEGGGNISCSVGPGGGGCFGMMWWEKDSDYEASVWDLRQVASAGQVAADVNGMSFMPAVVIPIPLVAPTQTTACKRLANQLRLFIVEGAG